jgi:hypothetical protein
MTPLDKIVNWNISRNLSGFNIDTEVFMLEQELQELREATTIDEQIDALCDLIVLATGGIHKLNYKPNQAMEETIKEISSRQGSIDPATGKWEKDRSQDPSTLYTANYNNAKY